MSSSFRKKTTLLLDTGNMDNHGASVADITTNSLNPGSSSYFRASLASLGVGCNWLASGTWTEVTLTSAYKNHPYALLPEHLPLQLVEMEMNPRVTLKERHMLKMTVCILDCVWSNFANLFTYPRAIMYTRNKHLCTLNHHWVPGKFVTAVSIFWPLQVTRVLQDHRTEFKFLFKLTGRAGVGEVSEIQ